MRNVKALSLAIIMALSLTACDDHPQADDSYTSITPTAADDQMVAETVDKEVQTPLQKSYDSLADCKKEFSTDGDCVSKTIIVNEQPQVVYYSPFFYPWGAIYHFGGYYTYGNTVPVITNRVVTTTLPPAASRPNYSNASSYTASRVSTLKATTPAASVTRGGFGGTARAASTQPSSTPSRSSSPSPSYGSSSRGGSSGGGYSGGSRGGGGFSGGSSGGG